MASRVIWHSWQDRERALLRRRLGPWWRSEKKRRRRLLRWRKRLAPLAELIAAQTYAAVFGEPYHGPSGNPMPFEVVGQLPESEWDQRGAGE